ncbi:hypothetical protein FK268_13520 [Tsukamurella sputi]|uniref:Uncharacterized protein n=1 Tax=Tsukamurella sputi TaxID=2591848 RepID=A0A5C5RMJ2_9ACTN|nr:hypothetical protein [Tsukamurella sputi]TWS23315.1 hypothetical protein FK268_13520 [Tsukamurella sputi]
MADDELDYDAIGDLVIDEVRAVVGDAEVAAAVDLDVVREVILTTLLREGVDAGLIREVDADAATKAGSYGFCIEDRISLGGNLIRLPTPVDPAPPKDRMPLDPVRKAEARQRAAAGESKERIAEEFNVHLSVIYCAVHSFD